MPGPVVHLSHISKSYPGVKALQDVSFRLYRGKIHALIGENGAGKSTLINILSGIVSPDTGAIHIEGKSVHLTGSRQARRHGIAVVHQELELFSDLNVAENIAIEHEAPLRYGVIVDWKLAYKQAVTAMKLMEEDLSPRLPASVLSAAQRQMVLIAAAVSESARVLILDEPTSSLSAGESQVLFKHLRRFRAAGTAILYVSHRLEEIIELADEVTVLRDGRHIWTGTIQETNRQHLIDLMVGKRELKSASADSRDEPSHGTEKTTLFACRRLSGAGGAFEDVTFELQQGEILGLYGLVGAGRSEWAQAVFGLRPITNGTIEIDGKPAPSASAGEMMRRGVAYIPEDRLRQGLCRGLPVIRNALLASLRRFCKGPWAPRREEENRAAKIIDDMGVRARSIWQQIGTLSGGNQQKVVVGRWLDGDPQVLILDEPTRGVDVGAKAEIHALMQNLARAGRGIVLISSDLTEVVQQSHRVGVFREGRLVRFFDPQTDSPAEIAAAAMPVGRTEPARVETTGQKRRALSVFWPHLRGAVLLIVILVLFGFLHLLTGRFLTWQNADLIISRAALLSFTALGASVVIVAGGIDISIDRLMAFSAGVAAVLWVNGWPAPLVCAAAIAVGVGGGLVNALFSLFGKVHPIVITLAMMSVYHGLVQWCIGGIIVLPPGGRLWLFTGVAGVPLLGVIGLSVTLLMWGCLTQTIFGRETYALGSSPQAAHRAGINHWWVWLRAFGLQGALVGFAGFLGLTYVGSVETTSFQYVTLQSIAAAVIGGVAITGGRGSALGVLFGCIFLASLEPACIVLGIPTTWQQTVVGGVMAIVVTADAISRKSETQK